MLLVSWGCHISAYINSRKKKETDKPRATLSSGCHEHTQALTRSRQLLSERTATPVLLAEIRGSSQELRRAVLGPKATHDATSSAA